MTDRPDSFTPSFPLFLSSLPSFFLLPSFILPSLPPSLHFPPLPHSPPSRSLPRSFYFTHPSPATLHFYSISIDIYNAEHETTLMSVSPSARTSEQVPQRQQHNDVEHTASQWHQATDGAESDEEATGHVPSDERPSADVHGGLPHESGRAAPQCRPSVALQPRPCAARVSPHGVQCPPALGAHPQLPVGGGRQ